MARLNPFRRRTPQPPPAQTAAAQSFTPHQARHYTRLHQPWQERARFFGKHLGVVRFGNGLIADLCARCTLRPERLVNADRDEWEPQDNPWVSGILRRYRNPKAETAELVRAHAWQYGIPGECMLVMDDTTSPPSWSIRSSTAVEYRAGARFGRSGAGWLVKDVPNGVERDGSARWLPLEMVRRLWVPDEDWQDLATSPMIGVLADCERYWALGRRARREADSALQNGILFTPESAHVYPLVNGKPSLVSNLDLDLDAIARAAWDDDNFPGGVFPFSFHWNGEGPKWIDVGRSLDERGIEYRQEALECIARGLPLPQRVLVEGAGTSNHWGDWLIQEDELGVIAGLMGRITHADITTEVLRPQLRALRARGQFTDDPEAWRVGYDPTPIVIHPDKAANAVVLHTLGLLRGELVLEAHGYNTSDMMGPQELAQWIAMQQAIRPRGGQSPMDVALPIGPGSVRELPPAPALSSLVAALAPYPNETAGWLD